MLFVSFGAPFPALDFLGLGTNHALPIAEGNQDSGAFMEMPPGTVAAWIAALAAVDLKVAGEEQRSIEGRLQDSLQLVELFAERLAEIGRRGWAHAGMSILLNIPFFKRKMLLGVKILKILPSSPRYA